MSSINWVVVGPVLAACILLLVYRAALPKPIPGIPYDQKSARSILGDLPSMMAYIKKHDQIYPWLTEQAVKHNSPIAQVFIRPFGKPWVILADIQESYDILQRRTKELDRSDILIMMIDGLLPENQICFRSHDPRFARNRALMKDLMTPSFINQVSAPEIYRNVVNLANIWTKKFDKGDGQPFEAAEDIFNVTLDSIFAATFGLDPERSASNATLKLMSSDSTTGQKSGDHVTFPEADRPAHFTTLLRMAKSIEIPAKSPLPRLHYKLVKLLPWWRNTFNEIRSFLRAEITQKIPNAAQDNGKRTCALDEILSREYKSAQKQGRSPDYFTEHIYDETFGFLNAGHDTTSTTVCWALKILCKHPKVQERLRELLRKAYPEATAEQRQPTIKEITQAKVPYLDATMEELFRTAPTVSMLGRQAMVDTTILGHHIPAGVEIMMPIDGPGYRTPAFDISDDKRSETSIKNKSTIGEWDPDTMQEFNPERWLKKDDENNTVIFDHTAGPQMLFGAGLRGCFGRRLAYLAVRIILVTILWNFQLDRLPDHLNTWDASDILTKVPRQVYVKLKKPDW